MKTLLSEKPSRLFYLFLILCACGCAKVDKITDERSLRASSKEHEFIIQYGWDNNGSIKYAAFTGAKNSKNLQGIVVSGTEGVVLNLPDGQITRLPSNYQLFQFVDGEFRQSKANITVCELEAFIESHPESYSIEDLLLFVNDLRVKKK